MAIFEVDNRYSVQIRNENANVTLIRNGEPWAHEPPFSKFFIAVGYRIDHEEQIKKEAIKLLNEALHDKYSDDPTQSFAYENDPIHKAVKLLERKFE